MREIKFRAWTGGKMMHWNFGTGLDNSHGVKTADAVMQYTGLKDRNGKDVFEGDVVECVGKVCLHSVEWEPARMFGTMGCWNLSNLIGTYDWIGEEVIVGNIYEHPHLLKP